MSDKPSTTIFYRVEDFLMSFDENGNPANSKSSSYDFKNGHLPTAKKEAMAYYEHRGDQLANGEFEGKYFVAPGLPTNNRSCYSLTLALIVVEPDFQPIDYTLFGESDEECEANRQTEALIWKEEGFE